MDSERILAMLAELDGYLGELKKYMPATLHEYHSDARTKRACERLLQISLETVFDVCNILVAEFQLGLAHDEDDVLSRLRASKIVSEELYRLLKKMKNFRNNLVHRYGKADDRIVFSILKSNLADFSIFKKEAIKALSRK